MPGPKVTGAFHGKAGFSLRSLDMVMVCSAGLAKGCAWYIQPPGTKRGGREELGRELLDKAGNESLLPTWALCHSLAPFPPEYALERTPHWIGHIHTRVTVLF